MAGLVNLGNTCFVASVVQAMAGCPDVVTQCRSTRLRTPPGSIGKAASELIVRLSEHRGSNPVVLTPSELLATIRTRHRNIGFAQQDAEEAFLIVTGALCGDGDEGPGSRYASRQTADPSPGLKAVAELSVAGQLCAPHLSIVPPPPPSDPSYHSGILFVPSFSPPPAAHRAHAPDPDHRGIATPHGPLSAPACRPPIDDHPPLSGLLASAVRCATCGGHRELRIDPFFDLSLSIPPPRHAPGGGAALRQPLKVGDLLAEWSADEVVEGALCDHCLVTGALSLLRERLSSFDQIAAGLPAARRAELERSLAAEVEALEGACGSVRMHAGLADGLRSRCRRVVGSDAGAGRVVKKLTVTRPPRVLALHLKRVVATVTGLRKDTTPVRFDPTLDISPCCTLGGGQGGAYRLASVVRHLGDAYGGHYVCYCRDGDGGGWTCFNDTSVSAVSLAQVLAVEAYILLYERAS